MHTEHIDKLNVFLVLFSLFLAIKLPFELFLFSYAVLGPLHYLTEINWLKSKSFFIKKQKWIWVLLGLTLLIAIPTLFTFSFFSGWGHNSWISGIRQTLTMHIDLMILTAFLFAIGIVNFEKNKNIIVFLISSFLVSILILKYVPLSTIAVSIFLPTLVHIYIFTLLFMIFGTINNKSKAGIAAIILLLMVPFVIFNLNIEPGDYVLSDATRNSFANTNLGTLNVYTARLLGADESQCRHLNTSLGIRIQIFIAFGYTYHYLNWFSKTSIIGWNKAISKPRFFIILALWVASILLYWFDYKTGLTALFFLSFLHIILEFPLNIVSIKGIYREIRK